MVIVGEPGDDPLLGATTLEGFGLVLDPFRRELRPMKLPLKSANDRATAREVMTDGIMENCSRRSGIGGWSALKAWGTNRVESRAGPGATSRYAFRAG
jgi:hypothetical protein